MSDKMERYYIKKYILWLLKKKLRYRKIVETKV